MLRERGSAGEIKTVKLGAQGWAEAWLREMGGRTNGRMTLQLKKVAGVRWTDAGLPFEALE